MEIVHGVENARGWLPTRLLANGGYDRQDAFHVSLDPENDDVVEEVVRAVAVIHNTDPKALTPLGNVVDPDALEALFGADSEGFTADAQATFVYEGMEITVNTDGNVWLEWV